MDIFYKNVEKETLENNNYRNVVYTSKYQQFVYMCLPPLDNIHMEIHKKTDQFIRIEQGTGKAILNNKEYKLKDGIGLIIPAGCSHEIINTSKTKPLKLYTIYSPPNHKPKTINRNNPDKKTSKKITSKKTSKKNN